MIGYRGKRLPALTPRERNQGPLPKQSDRARSIILDELGKMVITSACQWSKNPSLASLRGLDDAVEKYEKARDA